MFLLSLVSIPTVLRCEGDVVVQELPELHDHVGVPGVRQVLVGVVSLGHPPGVRQHPGCLTPPWFLTTILQHIAGY